MKDLVTVIFCGGALVGVLILLLLIGPVLVLWAINSLAEAGGADFYIQHTIWNYWIAFVLLVLVRGGSNSGGK